jgi:acetyl-CoA carboxylase carboxyl transferase subunit alpha
MSALEVPIVVVVIGEGGSGGALGIGFGDEIMMFEYSYYSVCSPEACATILWKDSKQAAEASEALSLTAPDLKELGIIDKIINEPRGGAHKSKNKAAAILKKQLLITVKELQKVPTEKLINNRYKKFRTLGEFSTEKSNKVFNNAQSS